MAAFNFPNSPSTNDIHNENGVSFKWNGTVWKKIGTVANQLTQLGVTGISTFSNDVRIVKSAGPLLELTTNTGAADATLRLSEGATGSTNNGGGMFYSGADNKLHITCGTNSTTKRITIQRDDGKVGIGSEIPVSKFDVADGTTGISFNRTNNTPEIHFRSNNVDECGEIRVGESSGGGVMDFKTKTTSGTLTTRVSLDASGNLTLGDTTYGSNLGQLRIINNAASTAASLALFGYGNTNTNDSFAKIQFASQENSTGGQVTAEIGALAQGTAERGANLIFKTRPDTSGSSAAERLRITSDGKIGINKTNPEQELHIVGDSDACVRLTCTDGGVASFQLGDASDTVIGGITLDSSDNSIQIRGNNNAERLRIDSGGNAIFKGSGTDVTITPTDGLINFGMDGRTSFVTGTNACYIYSGSGASGTIPAGTLILQSRSNVDRDIVFVAGSSPTERMRIKAGGAIDLSVSGTEADIYHSGSGDRWPLRLLNSDTTSGNMTGIYFGPCNNVAGAYISGKAEADFTSTANRDAGLEFGTRLDGNWKIPMAISAAGYVNKPLTPYFKANLSSGVRITSTGYAVFGSAVHNNGSHYNTSDGKFTAPIAGLYWLSCKINAYDRIDFTIRVNGSIVEKGQYNTDNDNVGWWSNQLTTITYMTAGQYAQVHVNHLDQQADPDTWCTFMGYLIG